jgi:hypothetical protein
MVLDLEIFILSDFFGGNEKAFDEVVILSCLQPGYVEHVTNSRIV